MTDLLKKPLKKKNGKRESYNKDISRNFDEFLNQKY